MYGDTLDKGSFPGSICFTYKYDMLNQAQCVSKLNVFGEFFRLVSDTVVTDSFTQQNINFIEINI